MTEVNAMWSKQPQHENCCTVYRQQQDNIRKIGTLRTEIARAEDERDRLRLCIQAIGAMTEDKVFLKTELERLEESQNDTER